MSENKLFTLFNSLSGVEKRELSKLLKSPFFNQKSELVELWNWMLSIKKQKKKEFPSAEVSYAALFPKESFDPVKWRHLQSLLTIQIEKLFAQRALQAQPIQSDLYLATVFRQKKLALPLQHVFRRAEERLAKLPQDQFYYHFQYQVKWEKYAALESLDRAGKNKLAEVGTSLDIYLVSSKLRLACLMESHRAVSNVDYDASFLPLLLSYLKDHPMREIPLIALYYHCYKALTDDTEANFRAFRNALEAQQATIPLEERTTFLLLAINFCIKQLNSGEKRYIREALDLYQTGLETQTLLSDGHLSRFAYKNIVALGLRLNEFTWVRKFIDDYAAFLEVAHRDTNRNYNLARLYFTKKEFEKAMPMLAQIDDSDLLLNLDSRVMLLKMYYETEAFNALDNLLASFRILLLRKKKVIGYHQEHYLNLLRYIKKMMRLNQYDKAAVAKFKKEVRGHSGVLEKEWILEQL